jgi:hypothetical protein
MIVIDNSGGISIDEFKELMNRLNLSLSKHRIGEIFAKVKKGSSVAETELTCKGTIRNNI